MIFSHLPSMVISQLKEQLSSEKRKLGFLFGAGSSMAVGIPGIFQLTTEVEKGLDAKYAAAFATLKIVCGPDGNSIEFILNKLRTLRDLIGDSETEAYHNIVGKTYAQEFDIAICSSISQLVSKVKASSIEPHLGFANWLFKYQGNRLNPIELFTTNYDLLFEEAFEEKKYPYFDGFVGSINPFIIPECIDAENSKQYSNVYVPVSWLRLWKIHGSINWYLYKDGAGKNRITRNTGKIVNPGDEIMIYPSRQKYDESRRLPFLLFHDRLRKYLSSGESMLLVNGYSFGDEHINEILFQALRANKRLAITALLYGEDVGGKRMASETVLKHGLDNPNLTLLGPDKACIGGNIQPWASDSAITAEDNYWIDSAKVFDLGNFKTFTDFLKQNF